MKKLLITIFIFSIGGNIYSQDTDVGSPVTPAFQLGGDIQGTIQNSVNESTGKVSLSAPLASISSSSVSYSVGLTYNGQTAFKNGQQTNKYNPTSIVGVGWSMGTPKIIVDNKSTGTRDDDDFYLIDGTTNSKLISINRGTTSNGSQWEFQLEKYAPWKIYFYHHTGWGDYWKVIKEDGLTYYFGNSTIKDGKEFEVRYGNWIGSSKQLGATSEQTIVWNITKIEDQWLNNLTFNYDMVKQLMSGKDQTEASYLTKVTSSNGGSIQLIYGSKTYNEFYEPHIESPAEPDAYQERYEKKFLQQVSSYNKANELVLTTNLNFTLNGSGLNTKRYLTNLIQTAFKDGVSEILPAQTFEYYLTGVFQGGLKKVSYSAGGSVIYSYNNKLLFNNAVNTFQSPLIWPAGYQFHSTVVKDNYSLFILRSENAISGGKYRFKIFRLWWNGNAWEHNDYTFPHLIADGYHSAALQDFYLVVEDDFYGYVYDKGTSADVYLFHLKDDGRTWNAYTHTSLNIGNENPAFVSGNGFVGLQNHRGGQLYTYVWNGSSWNYKLISQGAGQYYIAANNNFIISLNEDGGPDMLNGVVNMDNYYFHFLDAEKNWQTKSWTTVADPYIAQISEGSYWYPDNSIIGFMADSNPELFFRWDTNYNLTNVDNVMGGYTDVFPMQPVANSLFTIYDDMTKKPYKSARFNGINWNVNSPVLGTMNNASPQFGNDFFLYDYNSTVKYNSYNPNTNVWVNNNFMTSEISRNNGLTISVNSEIYTGVNKLYKRANTGTFSQIGSWNELSSVQFVTTDGIHKTYVEFYGNGSLFHLDKLSGLLREKTFSQDHIYNQAWVKLGRRTFLSNKTLFLRGYTSPLHTYFYRLIDDEASNPVYDIVVNHMDINDDNGSLQKIQYSYNKPKSTPDNSSTFYGEVVIENKGSGTGNIGKIVKIFNDGALDLNLAGLPQEVLYIDAANKAVKRVSTTWNKYSKSAYNGSTYFYSSFYIRPTVEKEELFFENSSKILTTTTHGYNPLGLKIYSTTTDSKGKTVRQDLSYAYQTYTFVNDKNMLSFPYQTTTKINNLIVNVEQSKWISSNGKAFINENWSGPASPNLRLNSQISKVLPNGTVVESNNGKGIFKAALFGYNDLYEVATVSNANHQEVLNQLDVTYTQLQSLSNLSLKTELLKLYDRLPSSLIKLSFYDANGRIVSQIDERKEETFVYYDTLGRKDYVTDAQGKILEKKYYDFHN